MFFFFNATATTEIYTLSLHDALPIWIKPGTYSASPTLADGKIFITNEDGVTSVIKAGMEFEVLAENNMNDYCLSTIAVRSEEHTSELQSLTNLVCRLLLEKKKDKITRPYPEQQTYYNLTKLHPPDSTFSAYYDYYTYTISGIVVQHH